MVRALSLFQERLFAGHPFNSLAHQVHCTHPQGRLHLLWAHSILTLVAVLLTGQSVKIGAGCMCVHIYDGMRACVCVCVCVGGGGATKI